MSVDLDALTQLITREAARAANETDLRVRIEPAVDAARVELGLTADPEREKSLSKTSATVTIRGRADTIYGSLVIEYEPPASLGRAANVAHAAKQARDYMWLAAEGSSGKELEALRRSAGVIIDGHSIGFLRATGPHDRTKSLSDQLDSLVPLEGPYPVSAASVDRLLIFLRALARKRLDGRGLAATFGPEGGSHLAAEFVSHLVSLLAGSTLPPRASVLRAEWYRAFGSVYVQDATKARDDARTLCQLYGVSPVAKLETLLFAIQTYYALVMKLLAIEVLSLQAGSFIRSQAAQLASTTEPERRKILQDLEAGDLFRAYGIDNFLEADYFAWYLDTWDADIDTLVRRVAQELGEFEPATSTLDPEAVHDLLKILYQYLVPKKIRHDLGEYYTPDWLADYVLDQAGFDGRLGSRFLDPGCGSGTFLMRAILRIKARAAEDFVPEDLVGRAILDTVVGFDLNLSPFWQPGRTTSWHSVPSFGRSPRSRSPCTSRTPYWRRSRIASSSLDPLRPQSQITTFV